MKDSAKTKLRSVALDLAADIFGGILYAAGIYTFASAAEFAPGGISGIAIILNRLFGLPIGIMTIVINIPVVLLCIKTLGRTFFLKSAKTMVITAVLIDFVFPLLPVYTGSQMLAAVYGGALYGVGLALIYARGSSTGGTDFLVMMIRKKRPHLSIGTIGLATDTVVILAGGLVFGNIDAVLYGITMTFVCTTVIDKILYGMGSAKMVMIITDKGSEIAGEINSDVERGVTMVKAIGTFTGSERQLLMCACSKTEALRVRRLAYKHDKDAMAMVSQIDETFGFGFKDPTKE